MEIKHNYRFKSIIGDNLCNKKDLRALLALVIVELVMFLFVIIKGFGYFYLPIAVIMLVFSIISSFLVFAFKADRIILFSVLVLMNIGFMVQQIESGEKLIVNSTFSKKLLAVVVVVLLVTCVYKKLANWIQNDHAIRIMMILQYGISIATFVFGKLVGNENSAGQSARIALFGMTLLEVVKMLYIFVEIGLICKDDGENISFFKFSFNRELVLMCHTLFLGLIILACNELGTLLVIGFVGLIILFIYGKKRNVLLIISLCAVISFVSFWALCDSVFLPRSVENKEATKGIQSTVDVDKSNQDGLVSKAGGKVAAVTQKLIERFGSALDPVKYFDNEGNQVTYGLASIATGGLLGIPTERYRLTDEFRGEQNDFIFVDIVHTAGFFMGFIVICCFFILLRRGIFIAENCNNKYFQGLVVAITLVINVETLIHIAYNNALFPVTGIPLYFVSNGFVAVFTGMSLIAILLVISTGTIDIRKE